MFEWLKNKDVRKTAIGLTTDMHSHLLPGIDDGVKSLEESASIIKKFISLGYKKLITTPHIISDLYRNDSTIINAKLQELKDYLTEQNIQINLHAAAEYYLDDVLFSSLEKDEPLLTLDGKHLLFETNFISEPLILKQFIFLATSKGYKLILAHPERYLYLQTNKEKLQDLLDRGVLFQLNISSLSGYYSKAAQKVARELIDKKAVHFLGSDCHNLNHIALFEKTINNKYFQKALNLPLLNNTL